MAPSKSTDVAVITASDAQSQYPVLFDGGGEDGDSMLDLMRENMGEEGFTPADLPRIGMPSGGATSWDLGEEEDAKKILTGIIVYWGVGRAYYAKSLDDVSGDDANQPPDCSSPDGKTGHGEFGKGSTANPTGGCADCPMNQWDSARSGKGKACAEQRQLWMLFPDSAFPTQVRLSPASIKPFKQYMMSLLSKRTPYYGVVTNLGLTKAVSSGGKPFAKVNATRGESLDAATRDRAKAYGETIKGLLASGVEAAAARGGNPGVQPSAASPAGEDPWGSEPDADVRYEEDPTA